MEYFFTAKENLPCDMGFSLYDKYHINWLFVIMLFIIITSVRYKLMSIYKRQKFRLKFGVAILSTEVYYQTILIVTKQFNINYLPLHLCGLAIFISFFDAIHPDNIAREILYCLCMPGAFMALLFPNWSIYPLFNFASINSFILHGLLITYPIMLIYSGEFTPDYKRLPKCILFLILLIIPMYIFNKVYNTNFLFLNTPSEGSPLVIFENWFGNPGYIFGMFIMLIICFFILYLPIIIKNLWIRKKRNLLEV